MKAILLFLLMVLMYKVGENIGTEGTLERIKKYIKQSKNWDEFMEKISVDFNKYDIKP
jgi:hypothetical protein